MERKEQILKYAEEIEENIIQFRRLLHQHPELSMKEYETSKRIAEELRRLPGMEVYTDLAGGTGVMGVLRGKLPGKCILLRADIDALPVEEENGLEFCSVNPGCMHACGHDAHASWVLGAAMILSQMQEALPGTVKFVFQPGEEMGRGAKEMLEGDHILENPRVDMAFAAHAWPSVEAGKIAIARRYAFGCPGAFSIVIKGKGGHGSWPHLAVNPIMVAGDICTRLPRILSERIDAVEPRVISIGAIHAGVPGVGNVIPEECTMNGTIRATDMEVMKQLAAEIERVVKSCCDLSGAEYEYKSHIGMYGVENDPAMTKLCLTAARKVLGGENAYVIEKDNLGGENFSEYSRRVPAAYLYVGIRNEKLAKPFSLHSPEFMLDESVLKKAAAVFAALIFEANESADFAF